MKDESAEKLRLGAKELGVTLTEDKIVLFSHYQSLLLQWNERINLTSIEEKDFVPLLFLDSLAPAKEFKFTDKLSLVDIGSGAGFPGIPIAIAFPEVSVTLLEATRKKVDFLLQIKSSLRLTNVTVLEGRAEVLARDKKYREVFDVVIARAVAKLNILSELMAPFTKVGGLAIALKGTEADQEIELASAGLPILGLVLDKVALIPLPGTDITRNIIYFAKKSCTPDKYPRTNVQLKRRPI